MSFPNWSAWAYSAKTGFAALLALWISLFVGLPMPFWAMSTAYIVSSPLSGATRSKAIYRVIGTGGGATVAVALVPLLVEWPELLSLALALWVGITLAISLLDRSPRAYMLMLAGYTAAIIGFPAVDRPEAVFDIAAARVTEIVLGITCATLVHSLLWPKSVATALEPRLKRWLADARLWYGDILRGAHMTTSLRDRQQLAVDAVECTLLATHIPFDTSHWREATASVQALLRRVLLLLPVLSGMADRQRALGDGTDAWDELLHESYELRRRQAGVLLDECDALLNHLGHPQSPSPLSPQEQKGTIELHADPMSALIAGVAATLTILVVCAIWSLSGWHDGASAAALAGVFCCLFAAMDNPVPAILNFGVATMAAMPLAGFYLFYVLPQIDGFFALVLVLCPALLLFGSLLSHPRYGLFSLALMMGFCSTLALQETYTADFAHFLNTNLAQFVAMIVAAGMTAGLTTISKDVAIARLGRRMRRDLVALARASSPPDALAALGRSTDQLALITQRLGAQTDTATAGLRDIRIAMNIVQIQHLRSHAPPALAAALEHMLRLGAQHWSGKPDSPAPPDMLDAIDVALRLTQSQPLPQLATSATLITEPEQGRAALVALRRNLFPGAPAFLAAPSSHAGGAA